MRIFYVCTVNVSVLESQVYELLKYYKKSGNDVVYLQGWRNKKERHSLITKSTPYNKYFQPVWYRNYPCYGFFHLITKKNICKALYSIEGFQDAIIHARDEHIGEMLMELKTEGRISNPVLCEFRGVGSIEMSYRINKMSFTRKVLSWLTLKYFERIEDGIFKRSDVSGCAVSSVSPTINAYFKNKYPSSQMPTLWNPNVAGEIFQFSVESRREMRSKLGFEDEDVIVVCSTGGGGQWQQDYLVIPYLIKAGFKVINLSKFKVEIPGVITMTVPFREMPAMLSAADSAVLWRERTMLNISASPSKFSEFATMGLCVIHNKSVDVATNYIRQSGNGFLLDDMSEINADLRTAIRGKMSIRSKIAQDGFRLFGIENVAMVYQNAYMHIKSNNQ